MWSGRGPDISISPGKLRTGPCRKLLKAKATASHLACKAGCLLKETSRCLCSIPGKPVLNHATKTLLSRATSSISEPRLNPGTKTIAVMKTDKASSFFAPACELHRVIGSAWDDGMNQLWAESVNISMGSPCSP